MLIDDKLCEEYDALLKHVHGPDVALTPAEHAQHAAAFIHHKSVTDDRDGNVGSPGLFEATHLMAMKAELDRLTEFLRVFALWRLRKLSKEVEEAGKGKPAKSGALPMNRGVA